MIHKVAVIKTEKNQFLYFSFCFLGIHLYMEVPRLEVKSELQLLVYITATATPDPSCMCDLHHNSQQRRILNPLGKARYLSNLHPHGC